MMVKPIVSKNVSDVQLVCQAIELVHKVLNLVDDKNISKNHNVLKAHECALKWNELFYQSVVSAKERR